MQRRDQHKALPIECPKEQLWESFLIGAIEQSTLDSMSAHLHLCSDCSQLIDRLSERSTKVQLVAKSPYLDEENYLRMVANVAEVRVLNNIGDTVVDRAARVNRDVEEPIPDMVGRFIVRAVLGSGGFGRVYLADDPLLNRSVAIKSPRQSAFGSEGDLSNFLNEARHAAALDHPGIVPIFDVMTDESGRTLIVMKRIEGKSLAAMLNDGPLELARTVRVMIQVARSMHFAHERGFVHRDLKPSNILIDMQGAPHVSDLGLGLLLDQRDAAVVRGGTPAYMSPEQVKHDVLAIDRRSDVWALGVMLAELVHGRRPFPQKDRSDLFKAIRSDEPLIESAPETKSLDTIIRRCLAKSPADRFATADLLAEELAQWLRQHHPTGLEKWRYGWRRNVAAMTAFALLTVGFVIGKDQLRRYEVRSILEQLESSPANQITKLVAKLQEKHATPELIEQYGLSSDGPGQLRLDTASIAVGDRNNETLERCVDAIQEAEPEEIAAVVDTLSDSDSMEKLASEIASRFSNAKFDEREFRLSAALAGLGTKHSIWNDLAQFVAQRLVSFAENDQSRWLPLFDPVGDTCLAAPLRSLMNDTKLESQSQLRAAHALARYLANDSMQLASIVGEADSFELSELVNGLKINRTESTRCLETLFKEFASSPRVVPDKDGAPPTDSDRKSARYAIALWLLGSYEACFEAIQHEPNPTLQTLVIHGLAEQNVDAKSVIEILLTNRGDEKQARAIQFGLLQTLAELPIDVAQAKELNAALQVLLNELQLSPDSGVHSSARLVASRLGVELRPLNPGRFGEWLVAQIGDGVQDFAIIEPCVTEIGIRGGQAPPGGTESWPLHRRRFQRRIAVAMNEVTIEQFRLFDAAYIADWVANKDLLLLESSPNAAMMPVSLEVAYRFCNAWSDAAGYERCYESKESEQGKPNLAPKENHLSLNGYRLPTDGEWELACRAGTDTSRYFGQTHDLVGRYGWTPERTDMALASNQTNLLSQRTAQLLPNRWGIFDMYGNAGELCDLGIDPIDSETETIDALATKSAPGPFPLIRGVSFLIPATPYGHSHCRTYRVGGTYARAWGMRVFRTLSSDDVSLGKQAQ